MLDEAARKPASLGAGGLMFVVAATTGVVCA